MHDILKLRPFNLVSRLYYGLLTFSLTGVSGTFYFVWFVLYIAAGLDVWNDT